MDPRAIVNAAIDTNASGVPDEIRADYVRRYPVELPELAELLPPITTPVTIINGRHDRVVPLANAEFLDERLPRSRLAIINASHFIWDEAPAEYASIVEEAITGWSIFGWDLIVLFDPQRKVRRRCSRTSFGRWRVSGIEHASGSD